MYNRAMCTVVCTVGPSVQWGVQEGHVYNGVYSRAICTGVCTVGPCVYSRTMCTVECTGPSVQGCVQ